MSGEAVEAQVVAAQVAAAVRKIAPGGGESPVPLHAPVFGGNEWSYVKQCLDTGWVSSAGSYVALFERRLAEYTGVKYAVAVNSGTAALHAALLVAGVSAGDEVLLPALTFVATANAVSYCGAVPHFIDSEERSLGPDPAKLSDYLRQTAYVGEGGCVNKFTGRRITAVIAMHTFGHPADLDAIREICLQFGLALVEDAAEALGSFYKGSHVGAHGLLSALSFNGNKIVTTGGGGAILTNELPLALKARHLTTTAKLEHRWAYEHDAVGFNYRMPNLNAAIGCAQLEQLPRFLENKRELLSKYEQALAGVRGVRMFREPDYARSNYWLQALLLDKADRSTRDLILQRTNDAGFMTRPSWTLLHKLPMYSSNPRMDLSNAEDLESRIVNLPSSASMLPLRGQRSEGGGHR
ncbi:LegC family aminotransferase [Cohnella hongkongensis]|uniref:LegC family aminotransferase n=1 Tax=Cohnella hongkongensis TaxID=178337 RepID=A0ABV9FKK4_9BACL